MGTLSKHRVLILGLLSPFLAVLFSALVGQAMIALSADPQKNWLLRLVISTAVMLVPIAITLLFALKDRRSSGLRMSAKVGIVLGVLSLALMAKPVNDGILRSRQEQNKRLRGVAAPLFETTDLSGNRQRLADYRGKVVLVNIWATWCALCRAEMPALDRLYRQRKEQGFVVLGLSDESVATQKRFLEQVNVSYPLLRLTPDVPGFYREIAHYPEVFLIDRAGRLQPAPESGQSFDKLEASVKALLDEGNSDPQIAANR